MVAPVLRAATAADSQSLFDWRNDAQTRAVSVSQGEIDRDAHEAWFLASLASDSRTIYLADVEGTPAGMVRFDLEGETAEVSINLNPLFRGQGLAGPILSGALARYRDGARMPVRLVAHIRQGNGASIRLFGAAGFVRVSTDGELDRFELPS